MFLDVFLIVARVRLRALGVDAWDRAALHARSRWRSLGGILRRAPHAQIAAIPTAPAASLSASSF